jgi:hypothetical protein
MAFFTEQPNCSNDIYTVGDALSKLTAFNAVFEASKNTSSTSNCKNPDDAAMWRKLVYEGVINVGGEPMELDFFEKIFGGKTEFVEAKKIHFRYNCDLDSNIVSAENKTGASAGIATQFQLHKSKHSGDGKYSYAAVGYQLYIYEDRQTLQITALDKTTDYGHKVTVVPNDPTYTVNIRKDKKILVMPVRIVGGLSSPVPGTTYQSPGYTIGVRPYKIRKDWSMPIDLTKGYEDVLQFAIMFNNEGQEIDCWEAYEKTKTRSDMKWAKNLMFFLGQRLQNPSLLGSNVTVDYSGFDGYFNTMHYGGGTVMDFDPSVGFDMDADFNSIILRNDSLKRTNEFVVLHGLPFKMDLIRNANDAIFKQNAGSLTFETFKRMGGDQSDIKKLGIDSYEYLGYSLHFKQVSALSDARGIGNFEFPYLGMFLPGNGLRDSKGKEVPAMQFFVPKGCAETGQMEEHQWDNRDIKGEETMEGYITETIWMITHAPHHHILANPVFS